MQDILKKYEIEIKALEKNSHIKALIVFGSTATQKRTPISDIDICIITDKLTPLQKRKILSYATEELDLSIFWDLPLSLQYNIMTQGKVIYSIIDLTEIRLKTINKWFDFRPTLNRLYKARGYPTEKY